jgi:iron complex transport system substrate-binding protein
MKAVLLLLLLIFGMATAFAPVTVTDARGDTIALARPAQRIVSLAPNVTELLFAAGAGARIVGTVEYSDYPPVARTIPRIGDYGGLNLEALLALRPDVVIAWGSGSPRAQVERLRELGIPVFVVEPRRLEDIAEVIEKLGRLTGSQQVAGPTAQRFRARLQALRATFADKPVVRVFYEVWHEPLTTVNGAQIISKVIHLCGGRNVFADLPTLAPQINVESVLVRNPDVIIASGAGASRPAWLDAWRQYPALRAVRGGHLYFINPDLIQRHTPRILKGAAILCGQLERARDK